MNNNHEFIRGAGILLPITSLPSEYGIGSLGEEAYHFVDLLVDLRQKYWQVLPLGPTSFGDSPYQAFSAFAGNPYMIDLDLLVKDGLLTRQDVNSYNWGDRVDDIDYAKLFLYRFSILKTAFSHFNLEDEEFNQFCEKEKHWLEGYSFYMSMKTFSNNADWMSWEPKLRDRDEETLKQYRIELKEEIYFWKFCQYKFFQQWNRLKKYANRMGVQLIGDIPLYVALDSTDVWENREYFQLDIDGNPKNVAGCPPDAFSDDGQKWGNPLYDWKRMEASDFRWWKDRIKSNAAIYDVIRFDHFIGVVRYYSIPAKDNNARNGHWEKGPGKKLTDAIESVLGETKMIVEDLGVSVPGVKKLVQKTGWPGMKILQFAFDGNTDHEYLPHNYTDTNIVVYGGTHDNETLVGFFRDKNQYELAFLYEYLNIQKKNEIPDAIIRLGYSSIANVVIYQMQDILKLGNEARMNLPSTIGTNWRWRVSKDVLSEERRTWIRTMATIYRR